MNFIKKLYNQIKLSYDDYWADYEKQMESLTPEERMAMHDNLFGINKF